MTMNQSQKEEEFTKFLDRSYYQNLGKQCSDLEKSFGNLLSYTLQKTYIEQELCYQLLNILIEFKSAICLSIKLLLTYSIILMQLISKIEKQLDNGCYHFLLMCTNELLQSSDELVDQQLYFLIESLYQIQGKIYIDLTQKECQTDFLQFIQSILSLERLMNKEAKLQEYATSLLFTLYSKFSIKEFFVLLIPLFNCLLKKKTFSNSGEGRVQKRIVQRVIQQLTFGEKSAICEIVSDILRNKDDKQSKILKQGMKEPENITELIYQLFKTDHEMMSAILLVMENSYHLTKDQLYQLSVKLCTYKNSTLAVLFKQQLFSKIQAIFKDKQLTQLRQFTVDRLFKLLRNRQVLIIKYQKQNTIVPSESDKKILQIIKEVQEILMGAITSSTSDLSLKLYIFKKIEEVHEQSSHSQTPLFSNQFYKNIIQLIFSNDQNISRAGMQTFFRIYELFCDKLFKEQHIYDLYSRQNVVTKECSSNVIAELLTQQEMAQTYFSLCNEILYYLLSNDVGFYSNILYYICSLSYSSNSPDSLIGFFHNIYQQLYSDNMITGQNTKRYEEFIYKVMQSQWHFDYDNLFTSRSFLIMRSFEKVWQLRLQYIKFFKGLLQEGQEGQEELNQQEQELTKTQQENQGDGLTKKIIALGQHIQDLNIKNLVDSIKEHLSNATFREFYNKLFASKDSEEITIAIDFVIKQLKVPNSHIILQIIAVNLEDMVDGLVERLMEFLQNKNIQLVESVLRLLLFWAKVEIQLFSEGVQTQLVNIFFSHFEEIINYPKTTNPQRGEKEGVGGGMLVECSNSNDIRNQERKKQAEKEAAITQIRCNKIAEYLLRIYTKINFVHFFPTNQNPENMVQMLKEKVLNNESATCSLIKNAFRLIKELDQICSQKIYEQIKLDEQNHNLPEIISQKRLAKSLLIFKQTLNEQPIPEDKLNFLNHFEKFLQEPVPLPRSNLISQLSYCKKLWIDCVFKQLEYAQFNDKLFQIQKFVTLLLKVLIAQRDLSPTSLLADDNYLRIFALKCLVDIITTPEYQQDIDWPDVLCKLGILCFDDNMQLRKILFYMINQRFHQLKRSFVVLFYFLSLDGKEVIAAEIRKTLIKYSENFMAQYLKSIKEQKAPTDLSRSPQYDIIYLLYCIMNHPLFLYLESNWKNVWKILNQFYDIVVVRDSQMECHEILNCLIRQAGNYFPIQQQNIAEYSNCISIAKFRPPKFGMLELDIMINSEQVRANNAARKTKQDDGYKERWIQLLKFSSLFLQYKAEQNKVKNLDKNKKFISEEVPFPKNFFQKADDQHLALNTSNNHTNNAKEVELNADQIQKELEKQVQEEEKKNKQTKSKSKEQSKQQGIIEENNNKQQSVNTENQKLNQIASISTEDLINSLQEVKIEIVPNNKKKKLDNNINNSTQQQSKAMIEEPTKEIEKQNQNQKQTKTNCAKKKLQKSKVISGVNNINNVNKKVKKIKKIGKGND